MRAAEVWYKGERAGELGQWDDGSYWFRYDDQWVNDSTKPGVSLTLPKHQKEFQSAELFPFFFNLIPEGVNKRLICTQKRIDSTDYFGILLEVAGGDTIGAVKVRALD